MFAENSSEDLKREREEKKRYLLRKLSFRPTVEELKSRKVRKEGREGTLYVTTAGFMCSTTTAWHCGRQAEWPGWHFSFTYYSEALKGAKIWPHCRRTAKVALRSDRIGLMVLSVETFCMQSDSVHLSPPRSPLWVEDI